MPFYLQVLEGKYAPLGLRVLVYNGDTDPSINSLAGLCVCVAPHASRTLQLSNSRFLSASCLSILVRSPPSHFRVSFHTCLFSLSLSRAHTLSRTLSDTHLLVSFSVATWRALSLSLTCPSVATWRRGLVPLTPLSPSLVSLTRTCASDTHLCRRCDAAENWTSVLGLSVSKPWRPWTIDACRSCFRLHTS
jgi:hypothetical protein